QGFAAADAAPALGQGEEPGLGVIDGDFDALAPGRAGDDAGIGIEPLVLLGSEEQRLVDAVLALDGEGAQLAEAELAIQGLGLTVVVQYRQVQVTAAAAHEVLPQMAYQHLAHAEPLSLAVGRQAPEAGALVR